MHPWPDAGIVAIEIEPGMQSRFSVRPDRCGGTLPLADTAVDALIGMNDEHVLAFVETLDRTDFHAVHVFAGDAVFGDDIGH
ncbi:hypothetical protein D3C86_1415340 [compost metagenome]